MSSDNPFTHANRAVKHNYHLLNDGSDDEADIGDRIEQPLPKRLHIASNSSDVSQDQLIEYAI
jgi:hypothetical protein